MQRFVGAPSQHIRTLALVSLLAVSAQTSHAAQADNPDGRIVYLRQCASCHGATGHGGGIDADLFPSPPRNLHEGFLDKYDDETLARRIRDGRNLPLFLDVDALRRHVSDVDQIIEHIRRLPNLDWARIEPGWSAYVDRCEVCHGPTGDGPPVPGNATVPADLGRKDAWKAQSDADRLTAIRHERAGMPQLDPPIGADEGRAIKEFVDLFSPGFSLFSRHCSNCHADDGRGVATLGEVAGELFPLPSVAFDAEYVRRMDPDDLRGKVWHMLETKKPSMPHFSVVLTEAEVSAVVRYLRAASTPAPRAVESPTTAPPAER